MVNFIFHWFIYFFFLFNIEETVNLSIFFLFKISKIVV